MQTRHRWHNSKEEGVHKSSLHRFHRWLVARDSQPSCQLPHNAAMPCPGNATSPRAGAECTWLKSAQQTPLCKQASPGSGSAQHALVAWLQLFDNSGADLPGRRALWRCCWLSGEILGPEISGGASVCAGRGGGNTWGPHQHDQMFSHAPSGELLGTGLCCLGSCRQRLLISDQGLRTSHQGTAALPKHTGGGLTLVTALQRGGEMRRGRGSGDWTPNSWRGTVGGGESCQSIVLALLTPSRT